MVVDVCCVGSNGRYMVVAGVAGIVLWDLVVGSSMLHALSCDSELALIHFRLVRWHYSDAFANARLIAHPSTDTFALLRPTPQSGQAKLSYALIFSAKSPQPVRAHTLPFVLAQVAWLGPAANRNEKFSLVGITSDSAPVVLGDNIQINSPEGSIGRDLSNLPASRTRPTLFQDIFGPSALANLDPVPTESYGTTTFGASTSTALRPPHVHGLDLSILDGPAHLLPPIESLFSSLIRGFVQPRAPPASIDTTTPSDETKGEPRSMEDIEMEDISLPIHQRISSADRIVDQHEMGEFTELFRQSLGATKDGAGPSGGGTSNSHSPKARRKETRPTTKDSNGINLINGNGHGHGHGAHSNGVHRIATVTTPSGSKSSTGLPTSVNGAPVGSSPRTEADSPTTGQKRKKSSTA